MPDKEIIGIASDHAGFELKANKTGAVIAIALPVFVTLGIWLPILAKFASGGAE